MSKQYLGDGVYIEKLESDGLLVLTTEDGINVTNRIYIDFEVRDALIKYLEKME